MMTITDAMLAHYNQLAARAEAAKAEVQRLHTALAAIDATRAQAIAEIEALHQYLDECFVNAPDQGRAVPLIDRVVLLVSILSRDNTGGT
jgi:hypothetical protein